MIAASGFSSTSSLDKIHFSQKTRQVKHIKGFFFLFFFKQHSSQQTHKSKKLLFLLLSVHRVQCASVHLPRVDNEGIKFPAWINQQKKKKKWQRRGKMGEGGGGRVSRRSRRATVSLPCASTEDSSAASRAAAARYTTDFMFGPQGVSSDWKEAKKEMWWWSCKYLPSELADKTLQDSDRHTDTQTDRQTGRDSPLPLHNTQRAAKCQSRPVIKHKSPPPRPRTTPPKKTHLAACLCSKVATHWVIILLVFNNEGTQSFLPHAHPFDLHCFHPAAVLLISVATWEAPGTDVNRGVHSLNLWGPFKV